MMSNAGISSNKGRPNPKSLTTTDRIPNPTPGEMLLQDFIVPMGLTQNGLARYWRSAPAD